MACRIGPGRKVVFASIRSLKMKSCFVSIQRYYSARQETDINLQGVFSTIYTAKEAPNGFPCRH